jgi:uncharacterized protein
MKLIDTNVLLYVINEEAAHHGRLLAWWERALNRDESLGLPWIAVVGFLRIATSFRALPHPLEPAVALQVVDEWLALPNVTLAKEKDGHWDALKSLLGHSGTAGNLTTDAHLAALAIGHDATLVSCDNDFGRFKQLRWENPLG